MKRKRGASQARKGGLSLTSAVQLCAADAAVTTAFVRGVSIADWTDDWWQSNRMRYSVLVERDRAWVEAFVGLSRALTGASASPIVAKLAFNVWLSLCRALRTHTADAVSSALGCVPSHTGSDAVVRQATELLADALLRTGLVSQQRKVATVNVATRKKTGATAAKSQASVERARNLERWRLQHPVINAVGSGKGR